MVIFKCVDMWLRMCTFVISVKLSPCIILIACFWVMCLLVGDGSCQVTIDQAPASKDVVLKF